MGAPDHLKRAAMFALLTALALGAPSSAEACTCTTPSVREALWEATVVAEMQIVDVEPSPDDADLSIQRLRVRVVRVFKGPPGIDDGEELWIGYQRCNSVAVDRRAVGQRSIYFLGGWRGLLTTGYCGLSLDAWRPLPLVLVQAREEWLRSRAR